MSVTTNPKLACIFPGQGSQSVGMLRELAESCPEVTRTFALASEVLGYDLWQLVSEGPADQLNLTEHTQPAMLAAGVAAFEAWKAKTRVIPAWMAGHSLGEYTALVCAGHLDFQAAVGLVAQRAKAMQNAVEPGIGAMAAILGLGDDDVVAACASVSTAQAVVTAANFNCPGQVVIAGHAGAVNLAIEAAKKAGAKKAVLLPVSVPSHCPLMRDAAGQFKAALDAVSLGQSPIAVIHNVDVLAHAEAEEIRLALQSQLHQPVRWTATIRHLESQGVSAFIECGPGKVLAGLNKKIVTVATTAGVFDVESLNKAAELIA